MEILVTSDTHGEISLVCDYIKNNKVDFLIHAGDYSKDALSISNLTGISYITVKGNNDYSDHTNSYEQIFPIGENSILLVHGHKENVHSSKKQLIQKAIAYDCNIVIFGHTHRYYNEYMENIGLHLINPGSPSLPRDNKPGFVILDVEDNINIERIDLT